MIDLSQVPFVDGHMHPPLRVRPQTVEEYRWPWFEGLPSESAQVTELVPYRWAIRQLADELGCAADERSVVAATRGLDPPTWLATVCERSQTTGLVVDTGYPPPDEALPLQQIRAAGVDVAPLLRLESVAGDLIAEGVSFADLLERYDAAVERRARRGVCRPQEHRGLSQRPRDPPVGRGRRRARARAPARGRRHARAGAGARRLPAAARAARRPPRRPARSVARRLRRPRSRPAPRQPAAPAGHARERGRPGCPLRDPARRLAVRARGGLHDRRLRERHAGHRDLHPAARSRRPDRGLALRALGRRAQSHPRLQRCRRPARAHRARRLARAHDSRPRARRAGGDRRALGAARPSAPERRSSRAIRAGSTSARADRASFAAARFDQIPGASAILAASLPLREDAR